MLAMMQSERNIDIIFTYGEEIHFKRNYAYHYPYPLNLDAMKEAQQIFNWNT